MRQSKINFDEMDSRNVQDYAGNKFTIFRGDGWKCTCCHDGDAVVNISGIIEECETWTQAEEFLNDWFKTS